MTACLKSSVRDNLKLKDAVKCSGSNWIKVAKLSRKRYLAYSASLNIPNFLIKLTFKWEVKFYILASTNTGLTFEVYRYRQALTV